jgi:hypothetical protein
VAVDAELISRMITQITLGTPKAEFPDDLTDEASALWDRLAADIAQLPAGSAAEPTNPDVPDLDDLTPLG